MTEWTEERTESLKKLWQDGLSASQIVKQLGGVSRSAVRVSSEKAKVRSDSLPAICQSTCDPTTSGWVTVDETCRVTRLAVSVNAPMGAAYGLPTESSTIQ